MYDTWGIVAKKPKGHWRLFPKHTKSNCAAETLGVVLQLVEGEERLVLGRKVGAAGVVVDGLLANKDRLALLAYQATMAPTSRDWLYADNALKNSNVKWKN